jgi:hypothetical protein
VRRSQRASDLSLAALPGVDMASQGTLESAVPCTRPRGVNCGRRTLVAGAANSRKTKQLRKFPALADEEVIKAKRKQGSQMKRTCVPTLSLPQDPRHHKGATQGQRILGGRWGGGMAGL